eukprot:TRINITY_DN3087_c0_g1_i6.p1 TRINITY_DN3087_c0_g1~~TRINITY_DN3087_c0_g1_i6.p1  ORF type:complete len:212 (+),score=42.10 TRINITY_DN3087_c0_g1_i6:130-765(+)
MNDVVVPLLFVFTSEFTGSEPFRSFFISEILAEYEDEEKSSALEMLDRLTDDDWIAIEARTFWCFSRVLETIQDHYTRDQPGIQKKVFHLKQLIDQIDPSINTYLEDIGLTYHTFAYLWMNCFLIRELKLKHVLRLWDTYFSEELGFSMFHVYFCAAFLKFIDSKMNLRSLDLEVAIQVLQHCHDLDVSDKDLEEMLSQAYIYQSLYKLEL